MYNAMVFKGRNNTEQET